jgi:hypothetical protein
MRACRCSRVVAAVVLAVTLPACGVTARWLFPGPAPEHRAPRFIFSASQLESIEAASDGSLRRARLGTPPYRNPSSIDLARCHFALWQRAHWSSFHDELPTYAIQYFGVTRHGERRILMRGFCEDFWNDERYRSELAHYPIYGIGAGRCRFQALCAPKSASITSFSFDVSHRR